MQYIYTYLNDRLSRERNVPVQNTAHFRLSVIRRHLFQSRRNKLWFSRRCVLYELCFVI